MAKFDPDEYLKNKNGFDPDAYLKPKNISVLDVPGMAYDNFTKSAGQAGKDIVQPFLSPVETAKSLSNLALGAVQKLIPGEQSSEKYANAVGEHFAKRYGGWEEFKRTAATDPVGLLLDASSVFSGGGTLAARAPGMVGKVARGARAVGDVVDPINIATKSVGSVLKGSQNEAAKRLMDQGVTPTAGQILGGGFKKAEDALESIPVLGSAIGSGRQRANRQLNQAAYDRALNPIGKSVKKDMVDVEVGSDSIAFVSDALSDAYEALLPKVRLLPDDDLIGDIAGALDNVKTVIDPKAFKTLENIIDNKVLSKLNSGETITGKQLKIIQSELDTLSSKYKGSSMTADQLIGEALFDVQSAFRKSLIKSNPKFASDLKNIDTGYANYARLRNAGTAAGADLGGFTPAQLRAAVKATDKSLKKGDFSRGRALMQDLSQDAGRVMGGNLPTSGSIERGILASLLAGATQVSPTAAGLIAGGSVPYLPGAQRGLANILTKRYKPVSAVGRGIRKYGPIVGRPSFQAGRLSNALQEQDN
tara:strand:- start:40 stop:1638 length:1599 start_codon:yes stop_codon:yes gene_type:complete